MNLKPVSLLAGFLVSICALNKNFIFNYKEKPAN
jgi:hypothetical protein